MDSILYRKRLFHFLFLIFFIFSFSVPIRASELDSQKIIRVGYNDYTGFIECNDTGTYSGFGYEYLQEIAAYTGWDYEFVYGDWDQCLQWLANGEIDLLSFAHYDEERAKYFDYTEYEAGKEYATLFVPKENQTIFYEDFESFDGLKIGMIQSSIQNKQFAAYAEEHHFTYQSVLFHSVAEVKSALARGEIDAIMTGSLRRVDDEKIVAKFCPTPFYFMTTKGNHSLISSLNDTLEKIQTTDLYFNEKLYNKYYGNATPNQLAFTAEETEYIKEHPLLRIAYNASWAPIEYFDPQSNRFQGISFEILSLIAESSGISFSFVPVHGQDEAIQLLHDGKVDLICGFPTKFVDVSDEVLLTKPYLEVPITTARFTATATPSGTIAIPHCCSWLSAYAEALYPDCNILICDDTESCIDAVKQHDADFVLENEYILYQYTNHFLYAKLEPLLMTRTNLPLSIGISAQDDVTLLTVLNKAIIQLDPDKVNDIILEHTMDGPEIQFRSIIQTFSLPVLSAMLLLLLLIIWRYKKKIERYAFIDPLTGQWNQSKFILSANKLLRAKGYVGYAAVSLDIDNFKLINTMHSFDTGNLILCALSDLIAGALHSNELFCRASNDNFVLLLAYQEKEELTNRLEPLMERIVAIPRTLKIDYQYTISCGVYLFIPSDNDIHRAIGWASLARKTMKEHHQNRIAYYDDSMRKRATKQQEIENRMESAIQNDEFFVYYQPKYHLQDEQLVGAEALVRWIPKDGDMVYPDEFIPLFESNGFIVKLDLYVFEQVCKQLRVWLDTGFTPCPISVNLSRVHLNQAQFYRRYLEIMAQYQIPTKLIELELTESTIFENKDQMLTLLSHLKKAGITISMDDFGTGYSSLNLLKDMPIDILKLDREFFNITSDTDRGKKIIQSIVYMAQQLDIAVVAEGVETLDQVDFLKSIRCDIVQGYYYSKPIPVQSFEKYLPQPGA